MKSGEIAGATRFTKRLDEHDIDRLRRSKTDIHNTFLAIEDMLTLLDDSYHEHEGKVLIGLEDAYIHISKMIRIAETGD